MDFFQNKSMLRPNSSKAHFPRSICHDLDILELPRPFIFTDWSCYFATIPGHFESTTRQCIF